MAGLQSVLLTTADLITNVTTAVEVGWEWECLFQAICPEVWQHQEEMIHYDLNISERQRW